MLQLLFNLIQWDVPRPLGIYYQYSAAPTMEEFYQLQDHIMFYLVLILFGVGGILTSVIVNYAFSKSPTRQEKDSKWDNFFWIILCLIIYLSVFPVRPTIFCMDDSDGAGGLLMTRAGTAYPPSMVVTAAMVGLTAVWLIWGPSEDSFASIPAEILEVRHVTPENQNELFTALNGSGSARFGLMEGSSTRINTLYIAIVSSISEGFAGVLEVSREIFSQSMNWLLSNRVWLAISSGEVTTAFSVPDNLSFSMSNYRLLNLLRLVWHINVGLHEVLGDILHRFWEMIDELHLNAAYVNQPRFYTILEYAFITFEPTSVFDVELSYSTRFDYAIAWRGFDPGQIDFLVNSQGLIELYNGDTTPFYDLHPEEGEGSDIELPE